MDTKTARAIQPAGSSASSAGRLARLGAWMGGHLRVVLVAWLIVLGVFGAFAPRVESALSGAPGGGAAWCESGRPVLEN